MQLIASRIVPFIDCALLEERNAREALLRDRDGGFFLYLSDSDGASVTGERLIPFVGVFVKTVDQAAKQINVEWEADY